MDKHILLYPHNEILLSEENEWTADKPQHRGILKALCNENKSRHKLLHTVVCHS